MKNKREQKRVRRFCLVTYIERDAVERFLKRSSWIQHYAIATHDRDTLADGTIKQVHTHLIIYTYEAKTATAIKKNFDRFAVEISVTKGGEPQNTLVQDCHDVVSQFRYLRHLDDVDKVQYESNEVYTDDDIYWKDLCRSNGLTDSETNTGLQMFDDICSGVSTRELIVRYGKEYIYHATHLKNCLYDHVREEKMENEWNEAMLISYFNGLLDDCKVIRSEDKNTFNNVLEYLLAETHIQQKSSLYFRFLSDTTKL